MYFNILLNVSSAKLFSVSVSKINKAKKGVGIKLKIGNVHEGTTKMWYFFLHLTRLEAHWELIERHFSKLGKFPKSCQEGTRF